jgi:hypothetical protein
VLERLDDVMPEPVANDAVVPAEEPALPGEGGSGEPPRRGWWQRTFGA